jgi:pimeloyl-ACP methyl ester carboxylesterase
MKRIRIGDKVVRIRDEGDSTKKLPIVFVHGAGASSVVWMDEVRRLSPRRRVIAPDLPGHGQSDPWHSEGHEASIAMYRDAIGTICATLKVEKVILAGHSMGGQIALDCAAAWPERVAGLVLIATGAQLAVSPRVFEVMEKEFAHASEWLARVSWSPATPRELVERWAGLMLTAEQDVAVGDFRAVERYDGRPQAAKVRAPTLVVGGGDDLLAPATLSKSLAGSIKDAELQLVPRAGHMVMLEQSDAFHETLDRFLATLP